MITERKAANALGGKTARACDSCLKKRARWFCAADDAFLCQACDTFVHSANQLASRHERVRLETASCRVTDLGCRFVDDDDGNNVAPTWFTRKVRTPRAHTKTSSNSSMAKEKAVANSHPLVPEMSSDESASPDESEEQILCRVPVFDEPFSSAADELCNELNDEDQQLSLLLNDDHHDLDIPEFIDASDAELAEFSADVESILGINEEFDELEGKTEEGNINLTLNRDHLDVCFEDQRLVKVEDDDHDGAEVQAVIACYFDPALDTARASLSWDFQYSSSPLPVEEEEKEVKVMANDTAPLMKDHQSKGERRMKLLMLNYETVITAWASQGSPWTDGRKPEFNSGEGLPDFMDIISPRELHNQPFGAGCGRIGGRDEEREARVLRYREKRRTRLFSKKVRYEVRKMNAEKRPRMKGRFVKRTSSFAGPPSSSFPNHLMNK